ncbi:MAG TPA: HAMP domain-containing sensor histidine kinase [Acidimicrobiales bacterium]|nr:HAMP domain-containing sensor histidine kinase [Acidimicrobiales bacterium]
MTRRLLLSYLSLTALVLLLLEVPLGVLYSHHERDALLGVARRDATALAVLAGEGLERPDTTDITALANQYRTQIGAEVAIYNSSGHPVVALDPGEPEEHAPDVSAPLARALAGGSGTATRSDEDGPQLVAAVPVRPGAQLLGAVVVAVPAASTYSRIHLAWAGLAASAAALLALAALVGLLLARSLSAPVVGLQRTARRLGAGELDARAPTDGPREIAGLAGEFNDMADRLAELVSAQRRFVADASHQLRTPLTALRLTLENMAAVAGPEQAAGFEAAESELARLARLIDGLLTLSRAEGRRWEREAVDVMEVVGDRRDVWLPLAEERAVSIAVDGSAARRRVLAVPGHLEQVLDNLLSNALEVSPEGSTITVSVEDTSIDGTRALAVHVRDEGPGLAEPERAHAFDRFWRGQERERGSGLGLAIVAQLVEANGGWVALVPAVPAGLDAVVVLPAA